MNKNKLIGAFQGSAAYANVLILSLILYFLYKTFYFALGVGSGISPDETTWFGRSMVFSKYWLLPENTADSYEFGLVTHIPFLYFWLMGKLVHLNVLGVSDLVFLRIMNILIALATLGFAWKTINLLTDKPVTRVLFMVLSTNTLMLTFLSSFVNYDNLVNFFAIASLYFLLVFFQSRASSPLWWWLLMTLAGCLTKISFGPYAVLTLAVLLGREFRDLPGLARHFRPGRVFSDRRHAILAAMCLLLAGLNLQLHLGNLLEFKTLRPFTHQVIGEENALNYRISARGHVVRQFREGQLTLEEARNLANTRIQDAGDRGMALYMLDVAAQEKSEGPGSRVDRFRYAFNWTERMLSGTYGIMAHKGMVKRGGDLLPYFLVLLLAAGLLIRKFRKDDLNGHAMSLLIITAAYGLILMQAVNYQTYHRSGVIFLALQGRYMFPVILAGYALAAYYLTSFRSQRVNIGMALLVAGVFMAGEYPWFLEHVTPQWLASMK